jgi:hypothetical protein
VSLINEALRKARQAASEHDAKQAEDLFRPRKAYPSRRSGGGGWLVTVMIAVAAGVIGASAAWWFLGDHQTPTTEAAIGETLPAAPAGSMAAVDSSLIEVESRSDADVNEASAVEAPTPQSPPIVDALGDHQAQVEPRAVKPPTYERAAASSADPSGERVFVMEADLGNVVLSLGYIVSRSTDPFAEINGIDVYVGSEIEGFVVEAIEADRVVLRDSNGPLVLRVP